MQKGLNRRQIIFVNEYLKERNGTQAAIKAGYPARTAATRASQLLNNVKIKEEIAKDIAVLSKQTDISVGWVLENLKEVAMRCMQKTPVMKFDYEDKCMKQVMTEDENGNEVGVWEFDSSGANKALELIGRHLNMFDQRMVDKMKESVDVLGAIYFSLSDKSRDQGIFDLKPTHVIDTTENTERPPAA